MSESLQQDKYFAADRKTISKYSAQKVRHVNKSKAARLHCVTEKMMSCIILKQANRDFN